MVNIPLKKRDVSQCLKSKPRCMYWLLWNQCWLLPAERKLNGRTLIFSLILRPHTKSNLPTPYLPIKFLCTPRVARFVLVQQTKFLRTPRVARFFLVQQTKRGKYTNMAITYTKRAVKITKALKHVPKFAIPRPSKNTKIRIFGMQIHICTIWQPWRSGITSSLTIPT
jgi:hypothetical protein